MTSTPRRLRSLAGPGAGIAAVCVACCIGPILSVLAAIGILSAVGALWVPMLAGVAVAACVAGFGVRHRSRRAARTGCGAQHYGTADLPMPAPRESVQPPR